MTLGQTEKAGSNFFPLLSLFVFFFLAFLFRFNFFFFFDRAAAARHSCCKFVAALVAVAEVVIYGMRWPKELLGSGSRRQLLTQTVLNPGLPSEICMPIERSCR